MRAARAGAHELSRIAALRAYLGNLLPGTGGLAFGTFALWASLVIHRVGTLVFSFRLGRLAGAEGVGVLSSVISVAWVVGAVAGLGLPDRAIFLAAEAKGKGSPLPPFTKAVHTWFLLFTLLFHAMLLIGAARVGDAPSQAGFARWVVVGAMIQSCSAFTLGLRRGQGRPLYEACGNAIGGLGFLAIGLLATSMALLDFAWVFGSASLLVLALWAWLFEGDMRPAFRDWGRPGEALKQGLPYLGLGAGAWFLGNTDILMARVACSAVDVGQLQVATTVVRSASLFPWILATLVLHRLERRWSRGEGGNGAILCVAGVLLGTVVAVAGYFVLPWLARGYDVPLEPLLSPGHVSLAAAPVFYGAVSLLPVLAARNLAKTLAIAGLGVLVAVATAFFTVPAWGITGTLLATTSGQIVVLILGAREAFRLEGRKPVRIRRPG
jgi:O-antigen/teichoic acid export membrane protein